MKKACTKKREKEREKGYKVLTKEVGSMTEGFLGFVWKN